MRKLTEDDIVREIMCQAGGHIPETVNGDSAEEIMDYISNCAYETTDDLYRALAPYISQEGIEHLKEYERDYLRNETAD